MAGAALTRARRALRDYSGRSDFAWRYVLNFRSTLLHKAQERPLHGETARVLKDLDRDGIAITSVSALFAGDGYLKELNAAVDQLEDELAEPLAAARAAANAPEAEGKKPFVFKLLGKKPPLRAKEVPQTNDVYLRYPLQDPISRIADAYFGMYARLHHYNVWCNFATQLPARQSQLWHRDPTPEDRYILKVFTSLTDVDDGSGPLSYAAGTHLKGEVRNEPAFLYKDGPTPRSNDDQMAQVVPPARWVKGVGPKGTMIFVDTRGYHKGGHVRVRDRIVHMSLFRPPGVRRGGLCTRRYRQSRGRP